MNIQPDIFAVGAKVRFKPDLDVDPELKDKVFTITEGRKWRMLTHIQTKNVYPSYSYALDYTTQRDMLNLNICAAEEQLEPVYDGDQKISWSECAWVPESLRGKFTPKPVEQDILKI